MIVSNTYILFCLVVLLNWNLNLLLFLSGNKKKQKARFHILWNANHCVAQLSTISKPRVFCALHFFKLFYGSVSLENWYWCKVFLTIDIQMHFFFSSEGRQIPQLLRKEPVLHLLTYQFIIALLPMYVSSLWVLLWTNF